jgi:hypothetical protein
MSSQKKNTNVQRRHPAPGLPPAKTPSVTIKGITYPLRFDFNALCEVEQEGGPHLNMLTALSDLAHISSVQLAGFLAAFIRAADPKSRITLREAASLISIGDIPAIVEGVASAMVTTLPADESAAAAD